MKLQRETLIDALDKVQHGISPKDAVPIFRRVYATGDRLFAFNGTSGVEAACALEGLTFDVEGDLFGKLIRALDGTSVTLDSKPEALTVKSGGHVSKLGQLGEEPPYPNDKRPGTKAWKKCPAGFVDALKRCAAFAATSDTRAFMAAIYIEDEYFYATDGSAGTRCRVEGMPDGSILIPRDAAETVIHLGQPKKMAIGPTSLWLEYGDVTFFTLLLPNEENAWPSAQLDEAIDGLIESQPTIEIPDDVYPALKRALIFKGADTLRVDFSDGGKGKVQLANEAAGFAETVKLDLTPAIGTGCNPELLLRALEFASEISLPKQKLDPFFLYGDVVECAMIVQGMS